MVKKKNEDKKDIINKDMTIGEVLQIDENTPDIPGGKIEKIDFLNKQIKILFDDEKEAWYAFKLETQYSKDEILEGYLNTINYGNGILGIENASLYYFNKSAKNLSLAEASMLAGIPKSPNNYSPLNDETAAKKRQKQILQAMVNNDIISKKTSVFLSDWRLFFFIF